MNSCENEQTDSVKSLVDRQQYHEADEHRDCVPHGKSDMVGKDLSNHNPCNTEDNGQQRTNDVSSEFAYSNLCCY